MQKENKKEKWGKPKLIILTRGRPEERVLDLCKSALNSGGSLPDYGGCNEGGPHKPCTDSCASLIAS